MKDAKLKSALADYVQANPILSSLSGATVFIYPLLILLTGIFHVSGLSQLNSLAMYLFWGSVVLLYAGNNGMFLTIGLGIQALMELISLFVMLFSYGSYFSVNALVEVLVTGTAALIPTPPARPLPARRQPPTASATSAGLSWTRAQPSVPPVGSGWAEAGGNMAEEGRFPLGPPF